VPAKVVLPNLSHILKPVKESVMTLSPKTILVTILFIITSASRIQAQQTVAIGTLTTNPKAILLLVGNNQGLIIPSVSDPNAIGAGSGDAGMIVFNTTDKKVYVFDGSSWNTVVTGGSGNATGTTYTLGFSNGQITLKDDNNTFNIQTATISIGSKNISQTIPVPNQILAFDNSTNSWKATTLQGDIGVGAVASGIINYNVTGLKGKSLPSAFSAGVLTSDAAGNLSWTAPTSGGAGTVTSVSGTSPISVATPTTTPVISITQSGTLNNGYLSSSDWNTFNNKVSLGGDLGGTASIPLVTKIQNVSVSPTIPTTNQILQYNGTAWVPTTPGGISFGNLTTATGGVTVTGGTGAVAGTGSTVNIQNATATQQGLLSSVDWNTFNSKLNNPLTTPGDLVFRNATVPTRLPIGANGQVLTINGGLPSWQTPTVFVNPMTTTGDLIFSVGTTPTRLPGAGGFLKSTGAAAPSWSAVNLATADILGTLPIANGGTGSTTANGALTNLGGLSTNLAANKILVGSASNVAVEQTLSGDASLNNGVLTLSNSTATRTNLGLGSVSTLNTITTTELTDGTIVDADINAGAAIGGTKVNPNFGAQNIKTTGTLQSGSANISGAINAGGTGAGFGLSISQPPTSDGVEIYVNSTSASRYLFLVDGNGPGFSITADGHVAVSGILSKGGGSFKIDHPLDPQNKYLYHSFVESPDMMNIYNGNIITDDEGVADVQLPDYFETLNQDFRYQLTVIGEFAQAIIYKKITGNKFSIKTDKPNIEVSWQVTGVRHDPFAEQNRIKTEVSKEPENIGKYLHPEAYGRSPEERIGRRNHESTSSINRP
jgi:hypothetical protein